MIKMWDIEQHIQKDEKIRYESTPTWISYFLEFFLIIITIGSMIITIWAIIIPILIFINVYLNKYSRKYIITTKRVAGRFGILTENFKASTFNHITSVKISKSIIGQIFNFGDVIIDTSGTGINKEFIWKRVKNPTKVRNMIEASIR